MCLKSAMGMLIMIDRLESILPLGIKSYYSQSKLLKILSTRIQQLVLQRFAPTKVFSTMRMMMNSELTISEIVMIQQFLQDYSVKLKYDKEAISGEQWQKYCTNRIKRVEELIKKLEL